MSPQVKKSSDIKNIKLEEFGKSRVVNHNIHDISDRAIEDVAIKQIVNEYFSSNETKNQKTTLLNIDDFNDNKNDISLNSDLEEQEITSYDSDNENVINDKFDIEKENRIKSHIENVNQMVLKDKYCEDEVDNVNMYSVGYETATKHNKIIIENLYAKKNLSDVIANKFDELSVYNSNNFDILNSQYFGILEALIRKLCLELPVNFKDLLYNNLLQKLRKHYKSGKIIILVHSNSVLLCKELVENSKLDKTILDNIIVKSDIEIGENECKVTFGNSVFEYNKEQLMNEIDLIVKQIK